MRLTAAAFSLLTAAIVWAQPAFTPEERNRISQRVLGSERARALGRELRILRIVPAEPPEKTEEPQRVAEERLAEVVLVDYATGGGLRVLARARDGETVAAEPLRGRPQSSEEERAAARELAGRNERVAAVLARRGRLEGGFAVDPPRGAPPGRYLEFHLVEAGEEQVAAEVIVDLTRGSVAVNAERGEP